MKDKVYDEKGNLTYYKSPSGQERWFAYDEQSRLTWYKEGPEGYEEWRDYRGSFAHYWTNSDYHRFVELDEGGIEIGDITEEEFSEETFEQAYHPMGFRLELMEI